MMLCTICARGGSQGVPGKNERMIAGRPLIAHTVAQARESGLFRYVAVSSDSSSILSAAKTAGAEFMVQRPDELATDTAAKPPAIRHCVETVELQTGLAFDILVDLDATSPLRTSGDIIGAVELLTSSGCGNVITGAPAHRSPYFNLVERRPDATVGLSKPPPSRLFRRQDAPPCFDMNASIYAWTRAAFFEGPAVFRADTQLFEMPPERSLDIDSELDWEIVSVLLERRARSSR
jgi:N-acylneuraminate cytidylyltransferase/CMP-N,N'-diacetyllegionaminic acid synthase